MNLNHMQNQLFPKILYAPTSCKNHPFRKGESGSDERVSPFFYEAGDPDSSS